MSDTPVDTSKRLRQAFGTFATGVTVVTAIDADGQPRGFTANSFTSVSLSPPLLLVCLSNEAATCPVFRAATHFCINVLAEDQQDVSQLFASPVRDRFNQIGWAAGANGCPILENVISWFECEMHEVTEAGDHVILIGKIIEHDFNGRSPLVYCSGSYVEFGLVQRAMESAEKGNVTKVSAVINCDGSIPMRRIDGKLYLPSAARVGDAGNSQTLIGRLAGNGIHVDMPFVCAVYEDAASRTHNVVYRGTGEVGAGSSGYEFISLEHMPWDELADDSLRMLLQRYIEENDRDAFGVYVGDTVAGAIQVLGTRN